VKKKQTRKAGNSLKTRKLMQEENKNKRKKKTKGNKEEAQQLKDY
jgi:hypothetical protein